MTLKDSIQIPLPVLLADHRRQEYLSFAVSSSKLDKVCLSPVNDTLDLSHLELEASRWHRDGRLCTPDRTCGQRAQRPRSVVAKFKILWRLEFA